MHTRSSGLMIAVAVIVLELIGGMQAYLNQLILPIMAQELNAQSSYGVVLGIAAIASMAGLPIGAALMNRVPLSKLLLGATAFLVIGSIASALAPHIAIYVFGVLVRGLAGSILAMTSIGAVALGLSGRARQLTLAFASASWMISSIIGPTYAAWVTHLLSWRWAMLLYLPFLVIARIIVAVNLQTDGSRKDSPFSYAALLMIIAGVTATIIPANGVIKIGLLITGMLFLGRVAIVLMPKGTFTQLTSRRAALAGMFFLTGSYFAANELVSLTAHDIYRAGADSLGLILTGGGLAWAVLGVLCGMKPANSTRTYRARSTIGVTLLAASSAAIGVFTFLNWQPISPTAMFVVFWTIAGVGMGLAYLDTLNILFEDPATPDGISIEEIASSSVIVESLSSTMFIPLTTSIVGMAFHSGQEQSAMPYGTSWVIVVALACCALMYLSHARPAGAQ